MVPPQPGPRTAAKGGALPDRPEACAACRIEAGLGSAAETEGPFPPWPQNKDVKRLVRGHTADTGERYTLARAHLLGRIDLGPLPRGWRTSGDHAADYEAGVLPAAHDHDGATVARLRLRDGAGNPYPGFGTVMQTIAATRHVGGKVRFSALIRAEEVTGWAGLWLRVDDARGIAGFDTMRERPVCATTDWTGAEIVLPVPARAARLSFGVILVGDGAVDATGLAFEQADPDTPVTADGLPDQPLNLDFGAPAETAVSAA